MQNKLSGKAQTLKRKPVVLMSMGAQERKGHDYQVMTRKYLSPLVEFSDCVPLLVPTCFGAENIPQYLSMVDGVYLTGAGTNIDPELYGQTNLTPEKELDLGRDRFDLPLIHAALEMGLPFFGVCRGMQELNVALGGDLHQKVYATAGFDDHREDGLSAVPQQYADSHSVRLVSDSWLEKLMGQTQIPVNSLHGQGIHRLGQGLAPLAHAQDGLIEAVYLADAPQFTLGVQWHPEWQAAHNPYSIRMYQAFGQACRDFAAKRHG